MAIGLEEQLAIGLEEQLARQLVTCRPAEEPSGTLQLPGGRVGEEVEDLATWAGSGLWYPGRIKLGVGLRNEN